MKKDFCENTPKAEQELIFHTEYTGSRFAGNSHPFLSRLELARKDSDENNEMMSEFYTSFGDSTEPGLEVGYSLNSSMKDLLRHLTQTVFQEKYFDIIRGQRNLFSDWFGGEEDFDIFKNFINEKTPDISIRKRIKLEF